MDLRLKSAKSAISRALRALPYYGWGRRCPICCKPSQRFRPYSRQKHYEAWCIHCGSLPRHRFVWLYFSGETDLLDGRVKRFLHVAPERCISTKIQGYQYLRQGYVTADILGPAAMLRMDITQLPYPNESFDVVYCSHVLEHVVDDTRALMELHRVLRKDGWAVLLVPITAAKTIEEPAATTAAERLAIFGQVDHVRRYGPDFVERLRESGFKVKVTRTSDILGIGAVRFMGLASAAGAIHYCTKQ